MESKELTIGRAGEHLVMYDLLSKGYKCFTTEQGLNYDVVIDYLGKMIRMQVKTTQKPMFLSRGRYKTPVYLFHVLRSGKNGKRYYDVKEFEVFALVCMDTKNVYYYPFGKQIKKTLILRDRRQENNYKRQIGRISPYIDEFTLEKCLNGL